jgi:hypothetical protein
MKSKSQIYVEQSNFLKTIGQLSLNNVPTAYVDDEGDCYVFDRLLTPDQALQLAAWIIETFTVKEQK